MAAGAASAKALLESHNISSGALPKISAAAVALPAVGVSGGGPRRAGAKAAPRGTGGKGAGKEQRKGDANAHANKAQKDPSTEICWRFNRGACTGQCARRHVCMKCKGNHAKVSCPQGAADAAAGSAAARPPQAA